MPTNSTTRGLDDMPYEPLSVFANRVDPAGVLDFVTARFSRVEVARDGTTWRRLAVPFGPGGGTLTLNHDPDYYAGPGWEDQVDGMHAFFDRFPYPHPALRDAVHALIGTFSFALAAQFDPDYDPDADDRLAALFDVAEYLDGVIVSPNALRDAAGRVLIDAQGWHDPDARWPKIVATGVGPSSHPPPGTPPDARRVARRSLALAAVTARAVIDRDHAADPVAAAARHGRLLRWLEILGIDDEFEPDELDAVRRLPGLLEPQEVFDGVWRIEGLAVLAWALGRYPLPPYDALVPTIDEVWAAVGFLDPGESLAVVRQAAVRPAAQLAAARATYFALHWRLREYDLRPQRIDFARVAAAAAFGPLAVGDLTLSDGELTVGGHRLDAAPADVVRAASSVARERHKALNWLCDGSDAYSTAGEGT